MDPFTKITKKFTKKFGKGQIKPKADWCVVDSPKKLTYEFVFVVLKSKRAKKTNKFVRSFFPPL